MQAAQHTDQALVVQQLVFGRQCLAAAQLGQHVVQPGEGDGLVRGLAGLAVGVELLGQGADAVAQVGGQAGVVGGERERLEAA